MRIHFVLVVWQRAVNNAPSNLSISDNISLPSITPCWLKKLGTDSHPPWSLTSRRMRKYPDQGQHLGQASAVNLVLSLCEWVKVTWRGGLGVYSSFPQRDIEPRVNIDHQPSVSLAGHCLTFQTSVRSSLTRRGKVRGRDSSME